MPCPEEYADGQSISTTDSPKSGEVHYFQAFKKKKKGSVNQSYVKVPTDACSFQKYTNPKFCYLLLLPYSKNSEALEKNLTSSNSSYA